MSRLPARIPAFHSGSSARLSFCSLTRARWGEFRRVGPVDAAAKLAHDLLRTIQNQPGPHRRRTWIGRSQMERMERRAFLQGAAIGAVAFTVGGAEVLLTPGAARAQGVPLRTLTAEQAATLDALGETL